MGFYYLIISFVILFNIVRPFTVLFHELGHGIPALLLTKDPVSLYIGSYGDPSKSLVLKLGRLTLFFKYNLFLWDLGLCVPHSKEISIYRNLIIIISGPIVSLLMGVLCCYITFVADLHGSLKLLSLVFLVSSIIDFFLNIIPNNRPIELYDGAIVYNDGQQFKQLFKHRLLYAEYEVGVKYYNEQDYEKASHRFDEIIKGGWEDANIYRLAISAYLQIRNYEKALTIHQKFEQYASLNSDDYANAGLIKSKLKNYQEALSDYQKSLDLNAQNRWSLNNRAYVYNLLEQYSKAIDDFDKAIEIEPEYAYAYNNRGLSKIKLGNVSEGLKDIEHSMALDDTNAYAYRNLGIYHFDRKEFDQALPYFEKAYQLDQETDLLVDYLEKTKKLP